MKVPDRIRLRIKREMVDEMPTIRIGKGGLSEHMIQEILGQLKKDEIVKVRMLESALRSNGRESLAKRAAEATAAMLVEVRGRTFVLYKPKKA